MLKLIKLNVSLHKNTVTGSYDIRRSPKSWNLGSQQGIITHDLNLTSCCWRTIKLCHLLTKNWQFVRRKNMRKTKTFFMEIRMKYGEDWLEKTSLVWADTWHNKFASLSHSSEDINTKLTSSSSVAELPAEFC